MIWGILWTSEEGKMAIQSNQPQIGAWVLHVGRDIDEPWTWRCTVCPVWGPMYRSPRDAAKAARGHDLARHAQATGQEGGQS